MAKKFTIFSFFTLLLASLFVILTGIITTPMAMASILVGISWAAHAVFTYPFSEKKILQKAKTQSTAKWLIRQ